MKITYLLPIDFFQQPSQLSSLLHPSHSSIFILFMINPIHSIIKQYYDWFQHQLQDSSQNIYFIYQYPHKRNWLNDILLWTNYDDQIFQYKENGSWERIEKERRIEYQKMDYYKLKMIAPNDFLSYIIYHSSFPTPYHILFLKKKCMSHSSSPHFLLSLSQNTKSILPILMKYKMIHLMHRKDREKGFREDEEKHHLQYEIVEGIQISKDENMDEYREKMWRKKDGYIRSALGCKRSHMKIMKEWIRENRQEFVCILEDDFRWYGYENIENILQILIEKMEQKDKEWKILYLTCHKKNRKRHLNTFFEIENVETNDGFATTGYILNPKYIKNIFEICQNEKEEIDVIYTKYIEHRYSCEPFLGYPCESFSDILQEEVHYDFQY